MSGGNQQIGIGKSLGPTERLPTRPFLHKMDFVPHLDRKKPPIGPLH